MKIVIRWRNPWLRIAVYALVLLGALVARTASVKFVYQGF
jgi:hypothetical protein